MSWTDAGAAGVGAAVAGPCAAAGAVVVAAAAARAGGLAAQPGSPEMGILRPAGETKTCLEKTSREVKEGLGFVQDQQRCRRSWLVQAQRVQHVTGCGGMVWREQG